MRFFIYSSELQKNFVFFVFLNHLYIKANSERGSLIMINRKFAAVTAFIIAAAVSCNEKPTEPENSTISDSGQQIESESNPTEVREITLAAANKYDGIQGYITEFNDSGSGYHINVKDYLKNYEYSIKGIDSAVNDLEKDIIIGNIPDIVYLDINEIQKLSSKGGFADIYELMENDGDISKDDLLPSVRNSLETDGHLYYLAPTFMISTIAAKSEFVSRENWSFSEFQNIFDSVSDRSELFEMGNNKQAVLRFLTDGSDDFVDNFNHSCSFDSPEFIQLLEFANTFPDVNEYEFEQRSCRDNTALLSQLYIESFRDFNVKKQCVFGDDMTFAGYPSENGSGSKIIISVPFAIMKDSPEKDGAWEFLKSVIDPEKVSPQMSGIPVTEKGFETVCESALEKPYFFDDLNNNQKTYFDEIGYDSCTNLPINVSPMSEADMRKYADFVRSIDRVSSGIESVVDNIVREETELYFSGEYSAQKCAEMIQNRVSILLSEQA